MVRRQRGATRAQFLKVVRKYGATVDWDSDPDAVFVDAPDGMVWNEGGVSALTGVFLEQNTFRNPAGEVYEDLIARMNYGLTYKDQWR